MVGEQGDQPFAFTGRECDPETGLYYYGARYYDTAIGRFITPDSIVPDPFNPQSFNRYAYVLNNPVKYTDPTGHYDITVTNPYGEDPDGGYADDGYADGGYEGDCPIFTCEEWSTGGRKVGDAFEDAYDSADDFINDSIDSIFGGSDFIDKEIEKAKRQAAQRYYARRKAYAAKNSYGQGDSVSNDVTYQSHWILRTFVPGQVAWDNAVTAFYNERYVLAVSYTGAMVGEQVLYALTLGRGDQIQQGITNAQNRAGWALFRKQGILNRGPNFRIGYGRVGGNWTFRISGNWIKRLPESWHEKGHIIIKDFGKIMYRR